MRKLSTATCPSHNASCKTGTRSAVLVGLEMDFPKTTSWRGTPFSGHMAPLWTTDVQWSSRGWDKGFRAGQSGQALLGVANLETQVLHILPLMEITHTRQQDKLSSAEASRTKALGEESAVMWVPHH